MTAVGVAGVAATVAGAVFIAQPPILFGQAAWDETRMLGASLGRLAAWAYVVWEL